MLTRLIICYFTIYTSIELCHTPKIHICQLYFNEKIKCMIWQVLTYRISISVKLLLESRGWTYPSSPKVSACSFIMFSFCPFPSHPSSPRQPLIGVLSYRLFCFSIISYKYVIIHYAFFLWLILLSIMNLRFTHVVACIMFMPFLLLSSIL